MAAVAFTKAVGRQAIARHAGTGANGIVAAPIALRCRPSPPPVRHRGSDPEPPPEAVSAPRAGRDESGAKGNLWFHRDPSPDLKVLNEIAAHAEYRRRQDKLAREDLFMDYLPEGPAGIADLLEPQALVVAQHPQCFTPQERIDAEVAYQRWRRGAENKR